MILLGREVQLGGVFTVELIHARTGLVKRRLRFRNLITNSGLNGLAGGASGFSLAGLVGSGGYVMVGTGTAAPAMTDTDLQTRIDETNADGGFPFGQGNSGAPDYYSYRSKTWLFTEAEANGNLTEVGVSYFLPGDSRYVFFTRQLFRDELGNPITITKTNEDQLKITYEIRVYPPITDWVQVVNINGVNYTVTHRPVNITDSNAWAASDYFANQASVWETDVLLSYTATLPASGAVRITTPTDLPYVADSFYTDTRFEWGAALANFATGIGRIAIHQSNSSSTPTQGRWQATFSPKLPKNDVSKLTVVSRTSWAQRP